MNRFARGSITSIFVVAVTSLAMLGSGPGSSAQVLTSVDDIASASRISARGSHAPGPFMNVDEPGMVTARRAAPAMQPGFVQGAVSDGVDTGPFATGVLSQFVGTQMNVAALTWVIPRGVVIRRTAAGPGLLWVRNGSVVVSLRGAPDRLDQGDRVVVDSGWLFEVEAEGDAARVSFLWLDPLPPTTTTEEDPDSGMGSISQPTGMASFWVQNNTHADIEAGILTFRLAFAPAGVIPEGDLRAFMGFLTWTDADGVFLSRSVPGLTGLYVMRGRVVVNNRTRLDQGACALSPSGASLRIEADEDSQILLFGLESMSGEPIGANLRFNNC